MAKAHCASDGRERIDFGAAPELPGVGVLRVDGSWHRWTMFHESYAVTSVRDGHGTWRFRMRDGEIEPARMMLIEPGEVHVTTSVSAAAHFDTLFVDPRIVTAAAGGRLSHFRNIDTRSPTAVAAFARLHRALRDPARAEELPQLWEEALHRLLAGETESGLPPPAPLCRRRVRRARDIIHDRYVNSDETKAVRVSSLAVDVGLSCMELIRGFRAVYGVPPYQYLVHLRLARARDLIARGSTDDLRSLTDVALAAGFFDLPHMDRFFRKHLRMLPRQYASALAAPPPPCQCLVRQRPLEI